MSATASITVNSLHVEEHIITDDTSVKTVVFDTLQISFDAATVVVSNHCSICLQKMSFDQLAKINNSKCEHFFHDVCLEEWMLHCSSCPLADALVIVSGSNQLPLL